MISWLKYPENKPKEVGVYYCIDANGTRSELFWFEEKWLIPSRSTINVPTHFTEINPPQSDIVQPSTEGC